MNSFLREASVVSTSLRDDSGCFEDGAVMSSDGLRIHIMKQATDVMPLLAADSFHPSSIPRWSEEWQLCEAGCAIQVLEVTGT